MFVIILGLLLGNFYFASLQCLCATASSNYRKRLSTCTSRSCSFVFSLDLLQFNSLIVLLWFQVHATIPRLILHLHDDDLNVRQACRV